MPGSGKGSRRHFPLEGISDYLRFSVGYVAQAAVLDNVQWFSLTATKDYRSGQNSKKLPPFEFSLVKTFISGLCRLLLR